MTEDANRKDETLSRVCPSDLTSVPSVCDGTTAWGLWLQHMGLWGNVSGPNYASSKQTSNRTRCCKLWKYP